MTARGPSARGLGYGVAAYAMWGLFPLYWRLLEPATPLEILAHRVAWSTVTMAALLLLAGRWRHFRAIFSSRRRLVLLFVASVVIAVNWGGFIYGVNTGKVVEVSLGYFINPLVTVLMGVLVIGERLRPVQWVAMGVAGAAVMILTLDYGRLPWVALLLAFSFGTYGLAKKQADVDAVESLAFETLVLFPVALGYLVWVGVAGRFTFASEGTGHAVLLALTGVITAVPLLCFGAAAIRLPMTTIGLLQYLTPTIQFLLGVVLFHEAMTDLRWVGFSIVWVALVVFTSDSVRHHRRQLRDAADASAL